MTDTEIKPCPHCGNAAALCQKNHELDTWYVACTICGATNGRQGKDATVQAWNARTYQAEINKASRIIVEDAAEITRLRAALVEAARKMREHAEHVNYYGGLYSKTEVERRKLDEQREFYKDELAKAQVCADEMAALAWKWKYKADCQRETIRALVVAARAMDALGWGAMGKLWNTELRAAVHDIQGIYEQAERGQTGKE